MPEGASTHRPLSPVHIAPTPPDSPRPCTDPANKNDHTANSHPTTPSSHASPSGEGHVGGRASPRRAWGGGWSLSEGGSERPKPQAPPTPTPPSPQRANSNSTSGIRRPPSKLDSLTRPSKLDSPRSTPPDSRVVGSSLQWLPLPTEN